MNLTPTVQVAVEPVDHPDAIALIGELDAHLIQLYPPEARFGLDVAALRAPHIRFALARDQHGRAHGCGGVAFLDGYAELKRMFVRPASRGRGVASAIVRFLEGLAAERGYPVMRLETGTRQHEALSLYARLGYARRGPFGAYPPNDTSLYMERQIGDRYENEPDPN